MGKATTEQSDRTSEHETPRGYQVSGSRTISAPVERLFEAWNDELFRRHWLPERDLRVRKTMPGRSLRIAWADGTSVDVSFYAKGKDKSQVAVGHGKLPDAEAAARMKDYWKQALDRLQELLEG